MKKELLLIFAIIICSTSVIAQRYSLDGSTKLEITHGTQKNERYNMFEEVEMSMFFDIKKYTKKINFYTLDGDTTIIIYRVTTPSMDKLLLEFDHKSRADNVNNAYHYKVIGSDVTLMTVALSLDDVIRWRGKLGHKAASFYMVIRTDVNKKYRFDPLYRSNKDLDNNTIPSFNKSVEIETTQISEIDTNGIVTEKEKSVFIDIKNNYHNKDIYEVIILDKAYRLIYSHDEDIRNDSEYPGYFYNYKILGSKDDYIVMRNISLENILEDPSLWEKTKDVSLITFTTESEKKRGFIYSLDTSKKYYMDNEFTWNEMINFEKKYKYVKRY